MKSSNLAPNCIFTEAYRTLRTNISFSIDRPLKTILVTSTGPQEGKTTVASNLAIIMAQAGNKVLIMDSDLRMPRQHKVFGLDKDAGLTNFLTEVYNTQITHGSTSNISLPDIYHLLDIQEKTGTLTLEKKNDKFILTFKAGKIIDLEWVNSPKDKRICSILVKSNKITSLQLEDAMGKYSQTKHRLGYSLIGTLINMGYIVPQDIKGPLNVYNGECQGRLMDIEDAYFSFSESSNNHTREIFDFSALLNELHQMEGDSDYNLPFFNQKIDSRIQNTELENLKVFTSGPIPPNPSELLGSRRMRSLITILKKRFDTIIFDSPPVMSVTDTSLLASFLDGVVFVIQSGKYSRSLTLRAKQQLDNVKAHIYGIVLNEIDMEKQKHYYAYSHYYTKNEE